MNRSFVRSRLLALVVCAFALVAPSPAQTTTFTTLAGTVGVTGTADGVRGAGGAQFAVTEGGVAVDGEGNVYVADTGNHTIRKIARDGVVSTLAGLAGVSGSVDGTGSAARFSSPFDVAVDSGGNVYVLDFFNCTIRKITSAGVVTTLAGSAPNPGTADGTGSVARFSYPTGLTLDPAGNLYVSDNSSNTIRKVTSAGVVTTLAGTALSSGSADGTGSAARFTAPNGIAADAAGNVYVADTNNRTIRKISSAGVVTTLAGLVGVSGSADGTGTAATFGAPLGLAVDSAGNLFVADRNNHTIRKITPAGVVTTLGGSSGLSGSTDGAGSNARFSSPQGMAVDGAGNVYVVDGGNKTIRWGATAVPALTSPTTATATVGTAFNSTVTWSGTLARPLTATGLPAGLSFDGTTGVISGTPTGAGTSTISLGAFNAAGTATATLTLTMATGQSAPVITLQPVSQVVVAGSKVTLTVTATGTPAPTYQWLKDGVALSGKTESSLVLFEGATADQGGYAVVVANSAGSVTSATAIVAVMARTAPVITSTSPSQTMFYKVDWLNDVFVGDNLTLAVTATGSPSPTYRWTKNSQAIAGATAPTLALTGVTENHDGWYAVVVANDVGSQTYTFRLAVYAKEPPQVDFLPSLSPSAYVGAPVFMQAEPLNPHTTNTYQWLRNGATIPGATQRFYQIPNALVSDDQSRFQVLVINRIGGRFSSTATLTVVPADATLGVWQPPINDPDAPSVTAFAPVPRDPVDLLLEDFFKTHPPKVPISGPGGVAGKRLTIVPQFPAGSGQSSSNDAAMGRFVSAARRTATGEVTADALEGPSTEPTYQWFKDGVAIPGAEELFFVIPSVSTSDAGSYHVMVTDELGTRPSAAVVLSAGPTSTLSNLSVRTAMKSEQILIVGAVVNGGAKNILIRAGGPALNAFGLMGMAYPRLELYTAGGSAPSALNNDWPASLSSTFAAVGAFPFSPLSKDAALAESLEGPFTVQAKGTGAGTVLVEAYDAAGGRASRLVNLSARSQVGTGADILIAGFFIEGTGTKQLLIRAVGPALADFGVTGTLADPTLKVLDSAGNVVATNNDWPAELASTFTQVGAFALAPNSKDAAVLVTLEAGAGYTVQVSGVDDGTGEALVELYEVL